MKAFVISEGFEGARPTDNLIYFDWLSVLKIFFVRVSRTVLSV